MNWSMMLAPFWKDELDSTPPPQTLSGSVFEFFCLFLSFSVFSVFYQDLNISSLYYIYNNIIVKYQTNLFKNNSFPMRLSLFDFYSENVEKYTAKYGAQCLVLIEVGSFMECYGLKETDPQLQICCNLLNLIITQKDKSDESSHYMSGFPTCSAKKYYKKLLSERYTVVCITQTSPPPHVERKVTKILSPGCVLSEDIHQNLEQEQTHANENSVLVSLLIEEDTDGEWYPHVAIFDTNLGTLELMSIETPYDNSNELMHYDNATVLHTLKDTLDKYTFHEVILTFVPNPAPSSSRGKRPAQNENDIKQFILTELHLQYHLTHFTQITSNNAYLTNPDFHTNFLQKAFPHYHTPFLSIQENLNLCALSVQAITNLVIILTFIQQHDENLAHQLPKPILNQRHTNQSIYMECFNDVYKKLNVFDAHDNKSLFHYLNFCQTALGKRAFIQQLQYPIHDIDQLNFRYNIIQDFITNSSVEGSSLNSSLKVKVFDLQRIYRRFPIKKLQPHEIPRIIQSNQSMLTTFDHLITHSSLYPHVFQLLPDATVIEQLREYTQTLNRLFNIEACSRTTLQKMENTFFNAGQFDAIDKVVQQIQSHHDHLQSIAHTLNFCITDGLVDRGGEGATLQRFRVATKQEQWININHTQKDGYFFQTTKTRALALTNNIQGIPKSYNSAFDMMAFLNQQGNFNLQQLTIDTKLASSVRITCKETTQITNALIVLQEKLSQLTYEYYTETLERLYTQYYATVIEPTIQAFTWIDMYSANAKMAMTYQYTKPTLVQQESGSITATQLRHPIIERIISHAYVPNDISLDNNQHMLLYGVNSVGKSSLLKSIALCVLMAQCGLFVPASQCVLSPYQRLFTRIGNDDNLFVAHSSFVKEMNEAKQIIKHATPFSLVIADELCASTESESALAIVASIINILCKRQSSFIFATHLFALAEHPLIVTSNTVQCAHLKVDVVNNSLVFERLLTAGLPTNRKYGMLVATKIIQDPEFEQLTEIASRSTHSTFSLSNHSIHTSKYNSKLWLDECQLCHYKPSQPNDLPLDTHHIQFQCSADANGFIQHFHKNELHNLVVLCKSCHIQVHQSKLKIHGYQSTDQGMILKSSSLSKVV